MQARARQNYEQNLALTLLASADCLPDQVAAVVHEILDHGVPRDAPAGYAALRDEFFSPEAIFGLARSLPELLAEITRRQLIIPFEEHPTTISGLHRATGDLLGLGIHDGVGRFFPPASWHGPFLPLLNVAPKVGLPLVLELTDHATDAWVRRERSSRYGRPVGRPLPQQLEIAHVSHEVWGNEDVWRWFRTTAVAPSPVACCLMALERWLSEWAMDESDGGGAFERLFTHLLQKTRSVAILGVLMATALKFPTRCAGVVQPLLRCPAFYNFDAIRLQSDRVEAATHGHGHLVEVLTGETGWEDIQRAAAEPHRRRDLASLALELLLRAPEHREALLPVIRAFPQHLSYTDARQMGDSAYESQERRRCEVLVLQLDVEHLDMVEVAAGKYELHPTTIPEHIAQSFESTRRQQEYLSVVLGLQIWARGRLEGESSGSKSSEYTPHEALREAKRLQTERQESADDGADSLVPGFLQENYRDTIVAVAAALVRHHPDALQTPDDIAWCRQQLVDAASAAIDDAAAEDIDPYALVMSERGRSAARALPSLLSTAPEDEEIRGLVAALCVHRSDEIRSLAYEALSHLWPQLPTYVWGCLSLGTNLSVRSRPLRAGEDVKAHVTWLTTQVAHLIAGTEVADPESLRGRQAQQVDWSILESVLNVLPPADQLPNAPWDDKILVCYEGWFGYTLDVYSDLAQRSPYVNRYVALPVRWTKRLCDRLGAQLLGMNPTDAQQRFIEPLLRDWERRPELMEDFLRAFLMQASAINVPQETFVILWRMLGSAILASSIVQERKFWRSHGTEGALAILIFGDPWTTWKTDTFAPIHHCIDMITQWCATVGPIPACFRALVRMLSTVGFPLFVEYGVAWLSTCLAEGVESDHPLDHQQTTHELSDLLAKAYLRYGTTLRAAKPTWRAYNTLVDRLVNVGEPAAAALQATLQKR